MYCNTTAHTHLCTHITLCTTVTLADMQPVMLCRDIHGCTLCTNLASVLCELLKALLAADILEVLFSECQHCVDVCLVFDGQFKGSEEKESYTSLSR